MAETIHLPNFSPINIVETSQITADVAVAATSCLVKNSDGISVNDRVVLGILGSENAELLTVSSVSGKTIGFSATPTTNQHDTNEPITVLKGDQIKLYRAANVDGEPPADASFSEVTTVTIQPDDMTTPAEDSSGGSDYWYKYVYRQSVTFNQTDLSMCDAVRGQMYEYWTTVGEVRTACSFEDNRYYGDDKIMEQIDLAHGVINGSLKQAGYTLPITDDYGLLRKVERQLAASYILMEEYRSGSELYQTGKDMYNMAMDTLAKIQAGKLTVVDNQGDEAAVDEDQLFSGWPNSTTKDVEESSAGGGRMFTRLQKL